MYGISTDSIPSHVAFRDKYGLTTPLLADVDHKVCEAYGVWKNPGIKRHTFIVAPDGKIQHHFEKVNTAEHAQEVLAAIG